MTLNYLYERLIDHRAEVESRSAPVRGDGTATCPVCGEVGPAVDWLSEHLRREHPLVPPVFLIGGVEARRTTVRRAVLEPGELAVGNATEVQLSLDGGSAKARDMNELTSMLSGVRRARVDVRRPTAERMAQRRPATSSCRSTSRIRRRLTTSTTRLRHASVTSRPPAIWTASGERLGSTMPPATPRRCTTSSLGCS